MKKVVIESPFAGDVAGNVEYARAALKDSLSRDEAPIASHLLYPQVLDDTNMAERGQGIEAGLEWLRSAEAMVVYMDKGISPGMTGAIHAANWLKIPVEYRYLYK